MQVLAPASSLRRTLLAFNQNEMKLEIALFHYETVLRPALDPPLPLQQRPALRPPPLRYLDLSAIAHRACRQVTVGLPLRRQLEPQI